MRNKQLSNRKRLRKLHKYLWNCCAWRGFNCWLHPLPPQCGVVLRCLFQAKAKAAPFYIRWVSQARLALTAVVRLVLWFFMFSSVTQKRRQKHIITLPRHCKWEAGGPRLNHSFCLKCSDGVFLYVTVHTPHTFHSGDGNVAAAAGSLLNPMVYPHQRWQWDFLRSDPASVSHGPVEMITVSCCC